jgi:2-dehydro-3-deoxyphosphogluconate aldolase / (4S)-4-hydroxy-2-oxoglutarate aldolase
MARLNRLEVFNTIVDLGLVPLFYQPDLETAKQIVTACKRGGCRIVEFTNRGDFALHAFTALTQHFAKADPEIILGIGSVVDAPTAALYISAGAHFVVSPILNAEVVRLCNRRKIACIPGCATLSEISQAEELGMEIIKIFPGDTLGGPKFIRSVLEPCPWSRIMPSGGVDATEENIRAWVESGAACVGMGGKLISKDLVAAGDYAAISNRVAQVLAWIKAARAQK